MRIERTDGGLLDLLQQSLASARALVPLAPASLPARAARAAEAEPARWPLGDRVEPFDPRHLSPRDMAERGMDLYAAGAVTWEEYSLLAFQAELHPAFEATIGALTGETASPDRPRDFVALWEDRLAFERRYNPEGAPRVARAERIARLLGRLAGGTTDLVA
jgi:hypothetical protein